MKGTYKSYGMPECCPGECKKFMLFAVCISLPELNFIPSMESKNLLSFFGKVLNHMVRQSNFLVCFLSSFLLKGQAFLTKITTIMCARICLKYSPVKIEIRFVPLKAALILHIFWDLEDFSWTDSKLSSFSCNGKTGSHQLDFHKISPAVSTITSFLNILCQKLHFIVTMVIKCTVWPFNI